MVTFFGAAHTDYCLACPGTPRCECEGPTPTPIIENGVRVFLVTTTNGAVVLVVEGKKGASGLSPGSALAEPPPLPGGRPDLLIEASLPLGNGAPAVICPGSEGAGGDGVPAVEPPDFGPGGAITDALKDFACRFIYRDASDPCTLNQFGQEGLGNPGAAPTAQFCGYYMGAGQAVPFGDTRFTVRLRDTAGTVGPPAQIIVRRVP